LLAAPKPTTMPDLMTDVLLVSKPVAPPWHDSSKNLVRDLARHMQRYRPVLLSRPGVQLDIPRARVEPIYAADGGGFSPAARDQVRVLRRLILGRKAGLWHFFFAPNPRTSHVARWSARARRARTVQTVCSAPLASAPSAEVLFADRIVVLSEHTRRRFLADGIAAERMRLIRPAVAALQPLDAAAIGPTRERLGLPRDKALIVYPGDLEFSRGAELALEAHAALPRGNDAWLILACRAKTTRARERTADLLTRASQLGIASSVKFMGETPFIHDLLAVADLITLPADTLYAKMDLPLVLVEAMLLARCVLVGQGTPAAELAEGGGAVSVATTRDAVSAMTRALLDDDARRAQLGATARHVALRDFEPERMAREYEALYDELCA
jgi:glycosyltransferase involved in cell wall biosynthesis